jgi:hypothetical protein
VAAVSEILAQQYYGQYSSQRKARVESSDAVICVIMSIKETHVASCWKEELKCGITRYQSIYQSVTKLLQQSRPRLEFSLDFPVLFRYLLYRFAVMLSKQS